MDQLKIEETVVIEAREEQRKTKKPATADDDTNSTQIPRTRAESEVGGARFSIFECRILHLIIASLHESEYLESRI